MEMSRTEKKRKGTVLSGFNLWRGNYWENMAGDVIDKMR